jgi:hypothetical protein
MNRMWRRECVKITETVCWHSSLCVLGGSESVPQVSSEITDGFRLNFVVAVDWPPLWPSGQSSWLQNGDILCFLWGTNWIYICYVEESRPPPWSSGQSSWLQIQRSGFDSWHYQIFWQAVSLERGPLSLVSTIEELLGRGSSGSSLEIENTAMGICCADHATLVSTNFADKRRSFRPYSSFED